MSQSMAAQTVRAMVLILQHPLAGAGPATGLESCRPSWASLPMDRQLQGASRTRRTSSTKASRATTHDAARHGQRHTTARVA